MKKLISYCIYVQLNIIIAYLLPCFGMKTSRSQISKRLDFISVDASNENVCRTNCSILATSLCEEVEIVEIDMPCLNYVDAHTQCDIDESYDNDDRREVLRLQIVLLDMQKKLLKEKELNTSLKNIIELQKDTIKQYESTKNQNFNTKINNALSGMFTKTQIELIMEPKKKVYKWTDDDIASAITLRSLSPKVYRYLRNEKKYPLPGLSTLRGWAALFHMEQGILFSILDIMKYKNTLMSATDKITILCFDETYLSQEICYDKKAEQFIGPHKCVQTLVARGLISSWRQPIYYQFDTNMSKEILFMIIRQLHVYGFDVRGIVSDMGPTNRKLWNELDSSVENPNFLHPDTTKRIHIFADVPHLLKLIRNHFVKSGFLVNDKFIHKGVVANLLKLNKTDFKLAYKITENHINVPECKKQSVKFAAQLFSNTVAKAILYCGENKYIEYTNWKEASITIQLINDWYDLLNTQLPVDNFVKSYGMDLEKQNQLLEKMDEFIKTMRVYGHKSMLPFQKGILYSNESLRNLLRDIKLEYSGIHYFITRRLNQDVLENLFSYLKGMNGANTHLSPLDFKHCLKWYLLGKHAHIAFTNNQNTEDTIGEQLVNTECLSATVLTSSEIEIESLAEINSVDGICTAQIPQEQMDLLKCFEEVPKKTIEDEAQEYVVGYVAKRFISKYPSLGYKTETLHENEVPTSWIKTISKGHLLTPSVELLLAAKYMEVEFQKLHGTDEVIKCLVRTRTFIRFNTLNKKIEAKSINAPM